MTAPVEKVSDEIAALRAAKRWTQVVCYHEAGHIIGCIVGDIPIDHVQMDHGLFSLLGGHVLMTKTEGWEGQFARPARPEALMCMAGQAAEEELAQLRSWSFAPDRAALDFTDCFEIIKRGRLSMTVNGAHQAALHELIKPRWMQLEGVAARLLAKRRLSGNQARKAAK